LGGKKDSAKRTGGGVRLNELFKPSCGGKSKEKGLKGMQYSNSKKRGGEIAKVVSANVLDGRGRRELDPHNNYKSSEGGQPSREINCYAGGFTKRKENNGT